jgi:hypothetical protein
MARRHGALDALHFGTLRSAIGWAANLFIPLFLLLAFAYGLFPNPKVGGPIPHIWIVSLTALAMAALAALMTSAAL